MKQRGSVERAAGHRAAAAVGERCGLGQRRHRRHAARARHPLCRAQPGASYRGLHDSLVNQLGNERPQMLLCLHEESRGRDRAWLGQGGGASRWLAIVHSNVGLMHATMAIFNAWCDRVPLVLLGATGPVDAAKRRPWIDWIHTARDQGALVRNYTKWDDQPASIAAAYESILRARQIAATAPRGPAYVVPRRGAPGSEARARRRCRMRRALPAAGARRARARARRGGGAKLHRAPSGRSSSWAASRAASEAWRRRVAARRGAGRGRADRSASSAPRSRPTIRCSARRPPRCRRPAGPSSCARRMSC